MAKADYTVPVKIPFDKGRYRHGHVKKLPANKDEIVSIMYADGKISSRSAAPMIHVPQGFKLLTT